jgi:hypothetical protein
MAPQKNVKNDSINTSLRKIHRLMSLLIYVKFRENTPFKDEKMAVILTFSEFYSQQQQPS